MLETSALLNTSGYFSTRTNEEWQESKGEFDLGEINVFAFNLFEKFITRGSLNFKDMMKIHTSQSGDLDNEEKKEALSYAEGYPAANEHSIKLMPEREILIDRLIKGVLLGEFQQYPSFSNAIMVVSQYQDYYKRFEERIPLWNINLGFLGARNLQDSALRRFLAVHLNYSLSGRTSTEAFDAGYINGTVGMDLANSIHNKFYTQIRSAPWEYPEK